MGPVDQYRLAGEARRVWWCPQCGVPSAVMALDWDRLRRPRPWLGGTTYTRLYCQGCWSWLASCAYRVAPGVAGYVLGAPRLRLIVGGAEPQPDVAEG